jgi:glycine/sarcosine N-methyltransferase
MINETTRRFYDELADDYHLIYADWDASIARQAAALDALIVARLGPGSHLILDCACGIGTQSIGLTGKGHRVIGTDLSPGALVRAEREAGIRSADFPKAAADLRALPFPDGTFEAVVCADNAVPHLLTPQDMLAGLTSMRRVLRPGGVVILTTRPYDELRASRPTYSPPWRAPTEHGRAISFQLWDWHDDGARYDLEHFTLIPDGDSWRVAVGRATYWAITHAELAKLVADAGFAEVTWHFPEESGFFQPLLTAVRRD